MPLQPFSLGNTLQQAEQINALRDRRNPNSLQNRLMEAQINKLGQQGFDIGQVNPRDFTAPSISRFRETGNFNDLERYNAPKSGIKIDAGDAWEIYHPVTSDLLKRIPKNLAPTETLDYKEGAAAAGEKGKQDVRLQTEPQIAGQVETAKGQASRAQSFIDEGIAAGDSYATIRRGIDLLESGVKTGGFDNLKLWATNKLGITGADEGELSANLGKAVLSQLRSTFGAQFTEREGERLESIEAGFGKSAAVNLRLLKQIEQIVKKSAERGITAAESSRDRASADAIRQALEFSLSPDQTQQNDDPLGIR